MNEILQSYLDAFLLGLSKRLFKTPLSDGKLKEAFDVLDNDKGSPESKFLKQGILLFQYIRAGEQLSDNHFRALDTCSAETLPVCSDEASELLREILDLQSPLLLEIFLLRCKEKEQIIPPSLIVQAFNFYAGNEELKKLLIDCSGERGAWIVSMSPEWQLIIASDPRLTFETGSSKERVEALKVMLSQDIDKGLEALSATWASETAAFKEMVLKEVLSVFYSDSTRDFLQNLPADKSAKVRRMINYHILTYPENSLLSEMKQLLKSGLLIKKAGIMNLGKGALDIQSGLKLPEHFKEYGIDTLEIIEGTSEAETAAIRLIERTPVSFYEEAFGLSMKQVISIFKASAKPAFIDALAESCLRFRDAEFCHQLYTETGILRDDFVDLLPPTDLEKAYPEYMRLFSLKRYFESAIFRMKWTTEFSSEFLNEILSTQYVLIPDSFINLVRVLPESIIDHLEFLDTLANPPRNRSMLRDLLRAMKLRKKIIELI